MLTPINARGHFSFAERLLFGTFPSIYASMTDAQYRRLPMYCVSTEAISQQQADAFQALNQETEFGEQLEIAINF